MRKLFLAVVVTAIAVAGFSVISQAGTGKGGTSWTFALTPNKANVPAGTDSLIEPAIKDDKGTADPDDDEYAETKKTTIHFPAGTAFDTSVPPRCTAAGGEVVSTNGGACKKAQIGSGDALSRIGSLNTAALLKAYNRKKGILFLVIACNPGTGPGQANPTCTPLEGGTFALEGTLGGTKAKRTLIVPTPQTLLDGNILITKFHLKTCNSPFGKKCKKVATINGKRVVRGYTLTPPTCGGKWKSKAVIEYDGGVASQTIPATQICRK